MDKVWLDVEKHHGYCRRQGYNNNNVVSFLSFFGDDDNWKQEVISCVKVCFVDPSILPDLLPL